MDSFQRIYDKFKKTVSARNLVSEGDVIVVAFSGGSDSGALLMLLKEYSREAAISLEAFHFNHMIRGGEALEDEAFSREFAESAGVAFRSESGDVPAYAALKKLSVETAAREMRYNALRGLAERLENETGRPVKIAVAHNKSDRAETVLLNMIRGTGIEGLAGIRYRNGRVIRPLLDITKEETFAVLEHFGRSCRTDSSNLETEYRRNRLRLEIIPYIDEKMNCDMVRRLCLLADIAEEENGFLRDEAENILGGISSKDSCGRVSIDIAGLGRVHPGIKKRVLKLALENAETGATRPYGHGVSITATMLERLAGFIGDDSAAGVLELGKELFCTKKGRLAVIGGDPGRLLTGEGRRNIEYGAPGLSDRYFVDPEADGASFETPEGYVFRVRRISLDEPGKRPGDADAPRQNDAEEPRQSDVEVPRTAGENAPRRTEADAPQRAEADALRRLKAHGDFDFKMSVAVDREALLASGLRLVIRHPEQGDVIKPLGGPGRKSLRRFLSDAGIDALKRPGLYVLACEEDNSCGGNSCGGEASCEEINSRGDEASCEEENLRGGEASCGICHVFGVRRGDIFAVQKETKSCIIIDCSKPDEQAALK